MTDLQNRATAMVHFEAFSSFNSSPSPIFPFGSMNSYKFVFVAPFRWLIKHLQTAIPSHPSQVPNAHFTVPYSKDWLSRHRARNTEHKARYAAHKKYGPVIRIAPTELSINCLEDDVKTFYGGGFEEEERYSMFSNYSHSVVFSHVYSNSFIHASEALMEILRSITYDRFIPRMRVWAETGTPVDIFLENNALFMDLTSAYFLGLKNSSNLVEDPDKKTVLQNFEVGLGGLNQGKAAASQAMEDFSRSMANRALETLQSKDTNEIGSYPTVYGHICQNPETSEPVSAEIINHTAAPHEGLSITIDSLRLLNAVLMETLRLYPAVLGPFTHQVPEMGAMIGKYLIPGGVAVSASVYTLHRNPDVFPDPLKWNPDRWLDASPEANKQMMRWHCCFGSGGSMCIGNHFAVRIMKAVTVAVFKEFQSVIVPETKIEQVEGFIGRPAGYSIMLAFKRIDAALEKENPGQTGEP
ncbi:hypothetical protein BOTCAL_0161g00180 [Botryotinia calthae]|uniref:Cytochrome P450 n=1 Tax=Botryotinia calthae TaxID=38488 RepID=A0A4Y8D1W6_9HELO|nr:hypothetical protein BOTCAL_0161g00180 [Botryotinia calthae]